MFVNTNIPALQSVFDLQNTTNQMDNVLQQLSTGYQINSAADNPAGLAISQEMQTQITGLNQAAQNAQNGISLLQTADGAMANIDTILQSMRSLASQAATGTNNPTDLQALQQEMNQYAQEITNIANTTQFNNLNLLSGAFGGMVNGAYNSQGQYVGTLNPAGLENIQIGANQGEQISLGINPLDAVSLNVAGVTADYSSAAGWTGVTLNQTDIGQYVTNLGNGLYSSAATATNQWTIAASTFAVAGIDSASTHSSTLGGGTAVAITAVTTGTANGDLLGTYVSPTTVTYTITITSVDSTNNTVTYSVTGSDGFSQTGLTAAVSTATGTALNAFTINDGGSSLTLYGTNTTVGTGGYQTGQTAQFTMSPASMLLGLYSGTAASNSNLVGSAITVTSGTSTYAGNVELLGSEMNSAAPLVLGSTTTSQQATLSNLNTLLGGTGGVYQTLTTIGSTAPTTLPSVTFQTAIAGAAAIVTGNGNVTTAATVSLGINISTQGNAETALTVIDQALTDVNAQRAVLGAYQNELQFAVSNAQTGANNLSAAQANIIDTNMALQMANLSKYQVLQQSGIAMLAQADQIPQAILKLIG